MKKSKNSLLHVLIVPLVAILVFFECFNMAVVEAATYIGALNDKKYDDFEDLVDDLEDDYKNKTVTIEMYTDWDYYKDHQFDERLYIPENCKATLNMHGHRFDRNNVKDDDYSKRGELIYVETGATLTINGASS
ncbi:MAG: hypothetical protein IKF80_07790 [Erysipelotrichaceae bacterium]|nr:hypothetical protein [Erysipelotrichaceae bacterium]